jgi:hypothetical protein
MSRLIMNPAAAVRLNADSAAVLPALRGGNGFAAFGKRPAGRTVRRRRPRPALPVLSGLSVLVILIFLLILWPLSTPAATPVAEVAEKTWEVVVRPDGVVEVAEQVVFTLHDKVNNLVIPIARPEAGRVALEAVSAPGYWGEVAYKPLVAGNWDANVFAGTYSVIEAPRAVHVKAYYPYGTFRSLFRLRYALVGAAVRHQDVVGLNLFPGGGEGAPGSGPIRVRIVLPSAVRPEQLDVLLCGVRAGDISHPDSRTVQVDIPDTVAGEHPRIQLLMPLSQFNAVPAAASMQTREQLLHAHKTQVIQEQELLAQVREAAQRSATRQTVARRVHQILREGIAWLSCVLGALGVGLFLWLKWRGRMLRRQVVGESSRASGVPPKSMSVWLGRLAQDDGRRAGVLLFGGGVLLAVFSAVWQAWLLPLPGLLLMWHAATAPVSSVASNR